MCGLMVTLEKFVQDELIPEFITRQYENVLSSWPKGVICGHSSSDFISVTETFLAAERVCVVSV